MGPAAAAAALAAGTLHAASAAAHHGGPGHPAASAVSASTSPQPPLLGGVSSSIQVWPLTQLLSVYFYIIDLPRGQIKVRENIVLFHFFKQLPCLCLRPLKS